jgi:fatty acid hydroxylase domain-containing protein 2
MSASASVQPHQVQLRWEEFLSLTGYNQLFLIAVMPTILTFPLYWTLGLLFTLLDFTGWLSKYKVQPGKNSPPSSVKFVNVIKVVLFNQLVVGAPLAIFVYEFTKFVTGRELTSDERLRTIPSFSTFALQLLFMFISRDFIYYYIHKYKLKDIFKIINNEK